MKAISLWQPWASLIAWGAKRYETRSWATSYRGPLVICAAKGGLSRVDLIRLIADEDFQAGLGLMKYRPGERFAGVHVDDLPFGAAVCVVNLIDCIPTYQLTAEQIGQDCPFGDFGPGRFAWRLELIRRIEPPYPVRGYQGLFDLPDMPHFEDGTC